MNLQVLIATINQTNYESLLKKMNIQSDAIIGNQCDKNEIIEFQYYGHKIKVLSFNERGVGLNRNNMLMRANADISLLADDDIRYVDNYKNIIIKEFENNPKADVIIFNLDEDIQRRFKIKNKFKVRYTNFMRFGAARIAFRTNSIKKAGIFFHLNFGGGTEHSMGEDTLFLASCLRNGLNIIAVPTTIGSIINERESTWFRGYNNKYFEDKGFLFRTLSKYKIISVLLCLQDAIRHRKLYSENSEKISWLKIFKLMLKGVNKY